MNIKLVRNTQSVGFTEGKLYINGIFECYTVEDADRSLEAGGVKIQNKTAIPKGVYEVVLSMSPRFKKVLPEILNVSGFSGVRIHSGNSSKDTEGCIILGAVNSSTDDDWVGSSKVAMDRFMPKLRKAIKLKENITLEIV